MIVRSICAALFIAVLSIGLAGELRAEPTQCAQFGTGGTTGDLYELEGQELVTVTTTTTVRSGISILWGAITLSSGTETTTETSVTFYRGSYTSSNGNTLVVNCSTGSAA